RTPLFEATDLYVRGMGEATDVVEKEMFTVGGPARAAAGEGERERESFSLRPEFTAGVVRAYREHGLDKTQGFLKVYSLGPLLRERLRPRLDTLCDTCKVRFDRNVFRVLDCKRCAEKTADLPPMAEHLCVDCAAHFGTVRAGLDRLEIRYAVDARLVRGFDYY